MQKRLSISIFLLFVSFTLVCAQGVTVYPFPGGLEPAQDCTVKIDGRETFVYDSPVGAFIQFESSKPVTTSL